MRIQNKSSVVSGAASGIGKEAPLLFAGEATEAEFTDYEKLLEMAL